MNLRAVIFDVYKTLLAVGPPPINAEELWKALCKQSLNQLPNLSLDAFATATLPVIARKHEAARSRGIAFPEIHWPSIASEVFPELKHLTNSELDLFLFRHAQLQRTVSITEKARLVLQELSRRNVLLGIASNAQPYTLHELDGALGSELTRTIFCTDLCFWSFQAGFSKPDPHVFQLLSARLKTLGVDPAETLMVGDRLDNDIVPSRGQCWQTWHFTENFSDETNSGSWEKLIKFLKLDT